MLATAQGYYNGEYVVVDETDKKELKPGDVLALVKIYSDRADDVATISQRRKNILASELYTTDTGRTANEIDSAIREMRDNDRV